MTTKMEQLETWLWEYLTDHGRSPSAGIKEAATKAGYSEGALQTAKNKLGIVIDVPAGGRKSFWSLPDQAPAVTPEEPEEELSTRLAGQRSVLGPELDRAAGRGLTPEQIEIAELKRKLAAAERRGPVQVTTNEVAAVGPIPEPGTWSRPAPVAAPGQCSECLAGGGDRWTHMAYCSQRSVE